MARIVLVSMMLLFCLACTQAEIEGGHPVVKAYTAAYNAKDLSAMSAMMHPDIEWLSVQRATIATEVQGKDALTESMASYFEDPNMALSSLKGWSINGNYVAVTETASWKNAEGTPKSQSALAVYELEDELIRRVYYYPAN